MTRRTDTQVKFMADRETFARFKEKAAREGHSLSWIFRKAIDTYLADDPPKKEKERATITRKS